ncbi:MAG: hypothetical protein KatS3mg103_0101 [Phycisphaerales bacterium]|nr:MAG: hypothetical protein KatS3mg103_0101 [Phycisphaerales bacterium]
MQEQPRVSVLVVSFNTTRQMTLECLETIQKGAERSSHEVIVVDNASTDGSAQAIAERFPHYRLIASDQNLGFARANNLAAEHAQGQRLLLLNPDTLVDPGAIDALLDFADAHPKAGIWGGKTRFADGTPNPTSCWQRPTPWSVFCSATGLAGLFPGSRLFNPRVPRRPARPGRARRGHRHRLLPADRSAVVAASGRLRPGVLHVRRGRRPVPPRPGDGGTADGHPPGPRSSTTGGQSDRVRPDKIVRLYTARRQLYARHWPGHWQWWADLGPMMNVYLRRIGSRALLLLGATKAGRTPDVFDKVWTRRNEWTGCK